LPSNPKRFLLDCADLVGGPMRRREEIVETQVRRLRSVVRHVYDRVPYYRSRFRRAGVSPDDIRGLEDLSAIPITSKADLQPLSVRDTVAAGIDPDSLLTRHTSGSTGEPLEVRRSLREERLLLAYRLRAFFDWGLRLRDRRSFVGLYPPGSPLLEETPLWARAGLLRRQSIH
jgi:phenylacetate-coenzyme A ligase PaaK-like adenylate-forming protein